MQIRNSIIYVDVVLSLWKLFFFGVMLDEDYSALSLHFPSFKLLLLHNQTKKNVFQVLKEKLPWRVIV